VSAAPRLSVILSTYERPDALALALGALRGAAAPGLDLEVLVADDGSGPETARVAREFASAAPFPVEHVRHEHQGFRLAAIRNRAARRARGEVLVFLDGDCLLLPRALDLHAARSAPGRAHTGARLLLGEEETRLLLGRRLAPADVWAPALHRARPGLLCLVLENFLHRFLHWKPRPKLVAANCGVARTDFERVNGFDERFVGWGYEDDDLARRLRRAGTRVADGSLSCLALHLFHPVHESHRPSARGTANHLYFRRERFLTRPRRGLVERPLGSLGYEVVGTPPPSLLSLLTELGVEPGRPRSTGRPEVSLVFSGTRGAARPRGEVAVEVPPEAARSGAAALGRLIEEAL
jgi:GT2 family glycosyltransferase